MNASKYVQYGCGFDAPVEWSNFDSSPTLRLERIAIFGHFIRKNPKRFPDNVRFGNIVRGPLSAPKTCKGVYASHVLEHMTYTEARLALRNTLTMLVPGGAFRVVVPDLRAICARYLNRTGPDAAHLFHLESGFGQRDRSAGLVQRLASW